MGNLIPLAAAFLLASRGHIPLILFFATVLSLTLIMASACVFNNYIDRPIDKKMKRTENRVLVRGLLSSYQALIFASILGFSGFAILLLFTNIITFLVAAFGFFTYVILYSFWKVHTIYGTFIGSLAGAVPPVVGYTAVTQEFDLGAFLLFAMLVLWQMPHFYAIALFRLEDYAKAGLPVLPLKRGTHMTKVRMLLYIVLFTLSALMLSFFHFTGPLVLFTALLSGLVWLIWGAQGFYNTNDRLWGRQMFTLSLGVLLSICLAIPLEFLI